MYLLNLDIFKSANKLGSNRKSANHIKLCPQIASLTKGPLISEAFYVSGFNGLGHEIEWVFVGMHGKI
jgi:hypothetical protein